MLKKIILLGIFALLNIYNVFSQPIPLQLLGYWQDENLVPSDAHFNTYNEVWGYAIPGNEYAIIGSTAGTHIIDVTDPESIFEAFFIEGAVMGSSIIHRDYHDFKGYLYAVADEGSQSTLQIIDLNQLPDTVITVYDSNELFNRSHNIFIDSSSGRLYTLYERSSSGFNPFGIYDISDPVSPQRLAYHSQIDGIQLGGVHDAFVKNDTAYLNCGYNGFFLADLQDVENPILLDAMFDYPDAGYNHSGWLSTENNHYYMADENHGYDMKVVDVSDKQSLEVIGTFDADSEDIFSIPHNPIVACNYLYIAYYYDGLQVYDISDPANPSRIFFYNTSSEPNKQQYRGAWGVYPFLPSGNILVSDMQEGLFVFEAIDENCNQTMTDVQEEIDNTQISVIPNPNQGQFEINNLPCNEKSRINVLNQQGVVLEQINAIDCNDKKLNLDHYAPGLYIINVQSENFSQSIKMIVQR